MKPFKTAGSNCSKCGLPTVWHSLQIVADQPINVFRCVKCDVLTAAAASTAENFNL
jgi:Zn ribbon nucleic-acid-binding protein